MKRVVILLVTMVSILVGIAIYWNMARGRSSVGKSIEVLTYGSFMNSWGPGPELAKRFEEKYQIAVSFQDGGDGALLLERLKIRKADVVVGLDQFSVEEAAKQFKWERLQGTTARFARDEFYAFDWAPMAFIYRDKEIVPPESMDDLLSSRFRGQIALQDPRISSPGQQFLFWVFAQKGFPMGEKGDGARGFLTQLAPNIQSISSSWSQAYGLFQSGHAKLVMSYLTSPLYHLIEEGKSEYRASVFKEGHPIQVEFAGVPAGSLQKEAALLFLSFLLEPESQSIIMKKNYMLPVVDSVKKGTEFDKIPELKLIEGSINLRLGDRKHEMLEIWKRIDGF